MDRYFVNKNTDTNPNNDHEVHKDGCHKMPSNRIDLGLHADCHNAVNYSKRVYYENSDGCILCIPLCHNV